MFVVNLLEVNGRKVHVLYRMNIPTSSILWRIDDSGAVTVTGLATPTTLSNIRICRGSKRQFHTWKTAERVVRAEDPLLGSGNQPRSVGLPPPPRYRMIGVDPPFNPTSQKHTPPGRPQ